jgi:hypothetical protein
MNRKDYLMIADIMDTYAPSSKDARVLWLACVDDMVTAFRRDSARFDEEKFIRACLKHMEVR